MVRNLFSAWFVSLLLAASVYPQVPAGGEFRVNTYTSGRQHYARAAMEPDGDFVVVWSGLQDGGYDVFGQRFAASGAALGSEFQINSHTTEFQGYPAVAVGSKGDFVVTWRHGAYSFPGSIQGRRYDAAGDPIGGDFLVNTPANYESWPRVGQASDGRFVVIWSGRSIDGNAAGIGARRFDASGSPIGSEFVVNTYTTGWQDFGDLAVEPNGNFVAVWEDFSNRDGSASAIFGQRYDASGNRLGSDFQVNSYTTGRQAFPSVSVSPAGGFVVAWSSPGNGSGYGVFARRFDASGTAAGDDFAVNTSTAHLGLMQVAHDAGGNFVVTWSGQDAGYASDAFAQAFDASGARRGPEFRVNTHTPSGQSRPSIASDSAGNFVVVWQSFYQDGSDYGIFAQRFLSSDLIFEDGFDPTPP